MWLLEDNLDTPRRYRASAARLFPGGPTCPYSRMSGVYSRNSYSDVGKHPPHKTNCWDHFETPSEGTGACEYDVCACMCMRLSVCVCGCVPACVYIYIYICVCVCV